MDDQEILELFDQCQLVMKEMGKTISYLKTRVERLERVTYHKED